MEYGGNMTDTDIAYKYQAKVNQHNKDILSCESNSLTEITKLLQDIVEKEKEAIKAKVIDNDLDRIVFNINKLVSA